MLITKITMTSPVERQRGCQTAQRRSHLINMQTMDCRFRRLPTEWYMSRSQTVQCSFSWQWAKAHREQNLCLMFCVQEDSPVYIFLSVVIFTVSGKTHTVGKDERYHTFVAIPSAFCDNLTILDECENHPFPDLYCDELNQDICTGMAQRNEGYDDQNGNIGY